MRNDLGKQIEEEYLDSKSMRDLLFVDSFDDIDFEEKTQRFNVSKTVDTYVLRSNGKVGKGPSHRFQIYMGSHPVSVWKEVQGKGSTWFEEEYSEWAQEKVKKGEEVKQEDIEKEFEQRGVSTLLCCDITSLFVNVCLIVTLPLFSGD